MALMSTPTRDSFFDPPPVDQSVATLILGNERLECRLVEISLGGFGVSVPRSTAWTGEPTARLLTYDAAYPVRILKQDSQYTGYYFTLQRLELDDPSLKPQPRTTRRWMVPAACCCATGLIVSGFAIRSGENTNDGRRFPSPEAIGRLMLMWSSTDSKPSHHTPAASDSKLAGRMTADSESSDDLFEMPAISVSLSSSDHFQSHPMQSRPSPSPWSALPAPDLDPQTLVVAQATRQARIKSLLLSAKQGPRWPANSITLPWLFSTADSTLRDVPAYRMSELARNDLSLFESGLKSLSTTMAHEATRSLRRALAAITTASGWPSTLESLPEVRLIRSDDAEVYFQWAGETIEILRVLPRDSREPAGERSSSPTSSLSPQSVKR